VKLFSYVVDHDTGFAPNPEHKVCTLVYCKFKKRQHKRRNIVELAEKDDWIIGTGGESKKSCGNGRIIYIMRVDEKTSFAEYRRRFPNRSSSKKHGEYALISRTFLYYGAQAIPVAAIPGANLVHLEKKGRGFRNKFPPTIIRQLADWVHKQHPSGKIGEPCAPHCDGIPKRARRCHKKP
jgi:hypothetical protein